MQILVTMFTESLSYAELNAWFRVGFFRVCVLQCWIILRVEIGGCSLLLHLFFFTLLITEANCATTRCLRFVAHSRNQSQWTSLIIPSSLSSLHAVFALHRILFVSRHRKIQSSHNLSMEKLAIDRTKSNKKPNLRESSRINTWWIMWSVTNAQKDNALNVRAGI